MSACQTDALDAPPSQHHRSDGRQLPLKKRRLWEPAQRPKSSCVAEHEPSDLSPARRRRTGRALRGRADGSQRRDVRRGCDGRAKRWRSSTAGGSRPDQRHRRTVDRLEPRDDSPAASTTTSVSLSADDTWDDLGRPSRPAALRSEDPEHSIQQAQPPTRVRLWSLACELAYRHLQAVRDNPGRRTDPMASGAGQDTCCAASGESDDDESRPLLSLLQGPAGLCIPDIVNPTEAASWLQATSQNITV